MAQVQLRKGDAAIMVTRSHAAANFNCPDRGPAIVYSTVRMVRIAKATRAGVATHFNYADGNGKPMQIDSRAQLLRIPADIIDVAACQAACVASGDWLTGWDSIDEARAFVGQYRIAKAA